MRVPRNSTIEFFMNNRKRNDSKRNNGRNRSSSKRTKETGNEKTYTGVVDVTRSGMAFIVIDGLDQDVRVNPSNLHSALDGDEVKVKIIRKSGSTGRQEGQVVRVLKRRHTAFTGTIQMSKGFAFLITGDEALPDIYITAENLAGAKDGDKAVVEISDWGNEKHNPSGIVTTVMDKSDLNDTAMKQILVESGFPLSFPEEVTTAAAALTENIDAAEIAARRDFRNTFTITIDPADAKDFDDAISIKEMENGHYEIGVHIADVSHYVRPGTALDNEAYNRATSVYLADRVLPMLPEKISNELCSLRPHEDKLTFAAVFEITPDAEVKKSWIGRTLIHSNHRFTYEEVQDIIEAGEGLHAKDVLTLNRIAQVFRKRRIRDGAINFTSQEVRFKLDENAIPIGVELKESKETHQLVEEMMLLANKTVAEYASRIKVDNKTLPFPYRVHDVPDDEKLKLFVAFAAKFGYKFDISTPEGIAHSFNEMLQRVKGTPEELVLGQLGIRTMSKAVYTTDNIGHYGLGFEHYCHFTSPIRRYPDVMVHRIIADCLAGHPTEDKQLEVKCRHCSEMERKAMEAERSANKYKQVEYMQKFIGEDFDAVISGVARFGFWAETLEAKCEGMVSIASLLSIDVFTYSEQDYALLGTHSHLKFRMGDTVRVKLVAASLEKRQLDYELVMEPAEKSGTAARKKTKK
jgi:ribonuclease R